jgi:hypothetical protein
MEASMRTSLRTALVIVLLASPAAGQSPSQAWSELDRALLPGQRIQIVDASQSTRTGRFDGVSDSVLRLQTRRGSRSVPLAAIHEVRREKQEWDGLLLGLAVGAAGGLTFVTISCHGGSDHRSCMTLGTLYFAVPGAVAGALVDRGVRGYVTVFKRPGGSALALRVAPLVTRGHAAVAVEVPFP